MKTRNLLSAIFVALSWTITPLCMWVIGSTQVAAQETVPLWKQGVSTWNGPIINGSVGTPLPSTTVTNPTVPVLSGFTPIASGIRISTPTNSSGLSISAPTYSKPYTVPTDPSASVTLQPPAVRALPGIQLPAYPTSLSSPLAGTSLGKNIGSNSGLSQSIQPTISAEVPTHTVTQIPSFDSSKQGLEVQQSAGAEADSTSDVEQVAGYDSTSYDSTGYGPTITDHVNAGVAVVAPPLHEEAVQWYQYPWRWVQSGWTNHAEFGLDGSSGNSDTLAIQTGLELKRKTKIETFAIDFDYRFVSSQDNTTEDNGRLNLDYDRLIGDTPWSYFGKFGMEWDKFKAFDLRVNLNGGLGYHWIRNDRSTFVSRFGAGASKEIGAPDDDWTPEAILGLDGEHRINKYHKVKGKVDYFPAWEDFSNYRLVTDLSWEILLDDEDNLSLKLAATDRYDSTPQGAKPNDLYYSLLLLVKF